jgi:hypothetical protein
MSWYKMYMQYIVSVLSKQQAVKKFRGQTDVEGSEFAVPKQRPMNLSDCTIYEQEGFYWTHIIKLHEHPDACTCRYVYNNTHFAIISFPETSNEISLYL